MLENPWSAAGEPHSCSSVSSFDPSGLAPVGIHYLLLSNLTTGVPRIETLPSHDREAMLYGQLTRASTFVIACPME